jgi:peptidoglycan-associated lipoprotein
MKTTFFRTLLVLALLVPATACSHKQDVSDAGTVTAQERQDFGNGPLTDTEVTDRSTMEGPTPGTQQYLVVNVGDRIFFDYDSYTLSPEAQHTAEMQAEWLKRYPNVNVTIEGHCDERGTREYNLALGDRRATAMKNYLVSLGIDSRRVNTISYGKERPAVMGSNPSAWAQNRRAVTIVN